MRSKEETKSEILRLLAAQRSLSSRKYGRHEADPTLSISAQLMVLHFELSPEEISKETFDPGEHAEQSHKLPDYCRGPAQQAWFWWHFPSAKVPPSKAWEDYLSQAASSKQPKPETKSV